MAEGACARASCASGGSADSRDAECDPPQPDHARGAVHSSEHRRRHGAGHRPGFIRFLGFALGSAAELEYHFIVVRDLDLIPSAEVDAMSNELVEVKKMLFGLRARVARRTPNPSPR